MSATDIEIQWGGFYVSREEGADHFGAFRLLDFNRDAYHAALFTEKFDTPPSLDTLQSLSPFIGHVPMDARALLRERELQLVGGIPLTEADLEGYMIYLENHDVGEEDRAALTARLLEFSLKPPLPLRLELINDVLEISEPT